MQIERQAISKNTFEDQNTFTQLLAQKYSKEFHLVDNPSLAFSLAKKSCDDLHINPLFQNKDKEDFRNFGSKNTQKKFNIKNQTRSQYHELKQKMKRMLKSIYECFEGKQFQVSEVFEYEQIILNGFLSSFISQLKKECREKGQFLDFIWKQTIHLLNTICNIFHETEARDERKQLDRIKEIHEAYLDHLQEQEKKKISLVNENKRLNQMIEALIRKLRITKKEAKKIFKESQNLVSVVNEFKDKNIDLEIKYMDLVLNQDDVPEKEAQELMRKKKELLKARNKEVLSQFSAKRKNEIIEHEIALEGEFNVNKFISQMKEQLESGEKGLDPREIQGNLQNLIEEIDENFEDNRFILRTKDKPLLKRGAFVETRNFSTMTMFASKSVQVQTTYTDKLCNDLINSIGVNTHSESKKKILKNSESQFENWISLKAKVSSFGIIRTVKLNLMLNYESFAENIISPTINAIKKDSLLIRYERDSLKKNKFYKTTSVQTREKLLTFSQNLLSFNSLDYLKNGPNKGDKSEQVVQFQKGREKLKRNYKSAPKRSRFFSREETSSLSKIVAKNQSNRKLSSVFSSKMSNFDEQEKEQVLPPEPDPTIILKNESRKNKQPRHSVVDAISKFRRGSVIMTPQFSEQNDTKFTSLSRKSKMKISPKIEDILTPKTKQVEEKFLNYTFNKANQEQSFHMEDIEGMLDDFMSSSNSSSSEDESQMQKQNQNQLEEDGFSKQDLGHDEKKENLLKTAKNTKSRWVRASKREEKIASGIIYKQSNEELPKKKVRESFLINTMISKMIKKKTQVIAQNHRRKEESIDLTPIVIDVRKKIRDSTFQTKKLLVPLKHKNLVSIISSVFTKSLELIRNHQIFKNFVSPLYETFLILYGSLPKKDIYSKMINFIAQLFCVKDEEPVFKSFLFFLNLEDEDPNCLKITTFDIYLYLNLVVALSVTSKPISELQMTYTTLAKIEKETPKVFAEENISPCLQRQLLHRLYDKLKIDEDSISEEEKAKFKLNLFSTCKILVSEMITVKESLSKQCEKIMMVLKKQREEKLVIGSKELRTLIQVFCKNKLLEVFMLKKIIGYKNLEQPINQNEFSTFILQLRVLTIEELYMQILIKFDIKSFQALADLENKAELSKNTTIRDMLAAEQEAEDADLYQQYKCMLLLHEVEKQAQMVAEMVLGKQLNIIFGVSLMILRPNSDSI